MILINQLNAYKRLSCTGHTSHECQMQFILRLCNLGNLDQFCDRLRNPLSRGSASFMREGPRFGWETHRPDMWDL